MLQIMIYSILSNIPMDFKKRLLKYHKSHGDTKIKAVPKKKMNSKHELIFQKNLNGIKEMHYKNMFHLE